METLTTEESAILRKIRGLSAERKAELERLLEQMGEAEVSARAARLAAFDGAFGAWSDMTDEQAEKLWQEIQAMRGVTEDDVPA
ncbi:MAG: hypothetical protein KKI08_19105 [Armatimonadetes bacterium]|nr:hypothetical protein [Armatimonadota bacterium]